MNECCSDDYCIITLDNLYSYLNYAQINLLEISGKTYTLSRGANKIGRDARSCSIVLSNSVCKFP